MHVCVLGCLQERTGEELAKQRGVPFIGRIPIDPRIAVAMDEGKPFAERYIGTTRTDR